MTLLGTTDATVSRTAANAKAHRVAGSEIPGRVAEEDPEREHDERESRDLVAGHDAAGYATYV